MKKTLFLIAVVFVVGCGSDVTPPLNDNLDRRAVLAALAENVIIPGLEQTVEALRELETAVNAVESDPTNASLSLAQDKWIHAARAWKHVEFYRVGKLDEEQDSLLHKIDYGAGDPLLRSVAINTNAVSNAIAAASQVNVAYVEGLPATLQGFPLLEQILFANGDADALAQLTTGPDAAKRRAYLKAATTSLHTRLQSVVNDWKASGGNFLAQFASQNGVDIGTYFSMTINDIVFFIETMRNEKVGRAVGKLNADVIQPDRVEAKLSVNSIPFLIENLEGLEQAMTSDRDAKTGKGIDALLDELDAKLVDQKLSTVILAQIDATKEKAALINLPLQDAVVQNKQQVLDLYAELQKLVKLTKTDMMGELGVMSTLGEGDGD